MKQCEDRRNKTYKVIDRKTKKEVEGAFVLLPECDSAARIAIASYAEATNRPKIARWLRTWLNEIHIKRMKQEADKPKPGSIIYY